MRQIVLIFGILLLFSGCGCNQSRFKAANRANQLSANVKSIVDGSIEQTRYTRSYDASYKKIDYPNGDVSSETGVCADVIVRSLRKANVDLQKEVHEDMVDNFAAYPDRWNLDKPDTNIDHRRVPNLMKYFERKGRSLPITNNGNDYLPGDIVVWKYSNGLLHMGIVINQVACSGENFNVVHNGGGGARIEDRLFDWHIIGHYRYFD